MQPFPRYLLAKISEAGLNQRQLSIALKHGSAVYINNIVKGRRLPPLDDVERWSRALKLRGEARREFIVRVLAEHLAPNVREVVEGLWQEHSKRRRR